MGHSFSFLLLYELNSGECDRERAPQDKMVDVYGFGLVVRLAVGYGLSTGPTAYGLLSRVFAARRAAREAGYETRPPSRYN